MFYLAWNGCWKLPRQPDFLPTKPWRKEISLSWRVAGEPPHATGSSGIPLGFCGGRALVGWRHPWEPRFLLWLSGRADWLSALFHERTLPMKYKDRKERPKKTNGWVLSTSTVTCHWEALEVHVSSIKSLIFVSAVELPWVNPLTNN